MAVIKRALLIMSSLLLSLSVEAHYQPSSAPMPAPAVSVSPAPSPQSSAPMEVQAEVSKVIEKQMLATMHKTEEFLGVMQKRVEGPATTSNARECLDLCTNLYSQVVEDVKQTLAALACGDYYSANVNLSYVGANIDTCEQCYDEMEAENADLKKFDDWVRGILGESHDALEQITS